MARHFKHWLKAYCDFTSDSEAPLDFHFWTGVSTIAAALRRRVWKSENLFTWTPNFYIVFVGPAGVVTKSTTLNIGFQMLRQVPGIRFGPDSMTWHGLAKKFEEAFEYAKWTTPAGVDEAIPMSALTCSVSELGTFLRPDDSALVSFLTDVWDGKERPFEHATGYSGQIKIENPWLNIIGATTPEWIQDNFPVSMLQQGIGSRIIFIHGDQKRHFTPYPSRVKLMKDYHAEALKLTEDLIEVSHLVGPYDLTDDAYSWGTKWYIQHNSGRPAHLSSGRYSGYLARKQTHLHKLAMVLAASQRNTLVIEQEDLETAEKALISAERSMIRVFENVGVTDDTKHVAEVTALVRGYGWITVPNLYKLCFNIMSERDFKTAVRVACDGDLLHVEQRGNERGLAPKVGTIH